MSRINSPSPSSTMNISHIPPPPPMDVVESIEDRMDTTEFIASGIGSGLAFVALTMTIMNIRKLRQRSDLLRTWERNHLKMHFIIIILSITTIITLWAPEYLVLGNLIGRWIAPSAMRLYFNIIEETYGGPDKLFDRLVKMEPIKMIGFPLCFLSPCFQLRKMTLLRYRFLTFAIEQAIQLRPLIMVFQLYSISFKLKFIPLSGTFLTLFETVSIMAVMVSTNIFNKLIFQLRFGSSYRKKFMVPQFLYLAINIQTTICIAVINYLCVNAKTDKPLEGILSKEDIVKKFVSPNFVGENALLPIYIAQLISSLELVGIAYLAGKHYMLNSGDNRDPSSKHFTKVLSNDIPGELTGSFDMPSNEMESNRSSTFILDQYDKEVMTTFRKVSKTSIRLQPLASYPNNAAPVFLSPVGSGEPNDVNTKPSDLPVTSSDNNTVRAFPEIKVVENYFPGISTNNPAAVTEENGFTDISLNSPPQGKVDLIYTRQGPHDTAASTGDYNGGGMYKHNTSLSRTSLTPLIETTRSSMDSENTSGDFVLISPVMQALKDKEQKRSQKGPF